MPLGRREFLLALLAITVVAFGLRIWGAYFGLPHIYHTDEVFEVARAVRLGMLDFDFDRIAKGGYYYILFLLYGGYFAVGLVVGWFGGVTEFANLYIADPSSFWVIGRTATVCFGAATVFLLGHLIGRQIGRLEGLLAALFLAFSFRHLVDSHYITVDVPMTFFVTLSLGLLVERVTGTNRRLDTGIVLSTAIAIMHKLPSVVLLTSVFAAEWLARGSRTLISWRLYLLGALVVLLYLAADPGLVINADRIFGTITDMITGTSGIAAQTANAEIQRPDLPNLYGYYFAALRSSQGLLMLVMTAVGVVLAMRRYRTLLVIHAAFVVPYFLVVASAGDTHHYYERYVVPMLPTLCIFAAVGLSALVRLTPPRWHRFALPVGLVLCVLQPALSSVQFNLKYSNPDTRTLAHDWLTEHLAADSRILMEGMPGHRSQFAVQVSPNREFYDARIAAEGGDDGKREFWERTRALQLERATQGGKGFALRLVDPAAEWPDYAAVAAAGLHYVVLEKQWFVAPGRAHTLFPVDSRDSRFAFYRSLIDGADATRLVSFDPAQYGGLGYVIEIWRIGDGG